MDLFALEREIVAQVEPCLTRLGFKVEQFPGKTEEFGLPQGKARAFVGFRMQRLQPPSSVFPRQQIVQPQIFQFQIIYQAVELRSHQGILNALPVVQSQLTGFVPSEATPFSLYLIEAGLVEVVQGLWLYSQMFELSVPYNKRVQP